MLKFLFLRGPVMYLKHMGTATTICPKSHTSRAHVLPCAILMGGREGGGRDCPQATESGTARGTGGGWGGWGVSVPEGAAGVRALPPSVAGVGIEETMCESRRESLPASGWRILCLFDFTFFWFRELGTTITHAWPDSTG